jgi:hypothetical protein
MRKARILSGYTMKQYYADQLSLGVPALSASIAKILIDKTPAHAALAHPKLRHLITDEPPSTDATESQDRGKLIHEIILGKGSGIVRVDASDWRTKAAQLARNEARDAGLIPVLERKFQEANNAAAAICSRMGEAGFPMLGDSEVMVVWEETATDGSVVMCKGMIDHICRAAAANGNVSSAFDLKTVENASPDSCERQANEFGHRIQAAAYMSALMKAYPDNCHTVFSFLFAECEPPYCVTVAALDAEHEEYGKRHWQKAVDIWAKCLRSGEWPASYSNEAVMLRAKPWNVQRWEEQDA